MLISFNIFGLFKVDVLLKHKIKCFNYLLLAHTNLHFDKNTARFRDKSGFEKGVGG